MKKNLSILLLLLMGLVAGAQPQFRTVKVDPQTVNGFTVSATKPAQGVTVQPTAVNLLSAVAPKALAAAKPQGMMLMAANGSSAALLEEDFESTADGARPTDWTSSEWVAMNLYGSAHSGNMAMYITAVTESWLYTSELQLEADVEYSISYWVNMTGVDDGLEMYIQEDNETPWRRLRNTVSTEGSWSEVSTTWTPSTSGTYRLCFRAKTDAAAVDGIFLDDVNVAGPGGAPTPSAALLDENFESAAEGDVASGWMALDQGGNNNKWGATNAGGAQGMVMYATTTGAVQNTWLISPVIALAAGVEYNISCQAYVIGGSDNLEIRLVDENLLHFDELLIQSGATSGTQELATSFTPTAGGSYRLLFVAKTTDSYGTGMLIDDVKVTEPSVVPPSPSAALLEEDFESVADGAVPTDWTAYDNGGTGRVWSVLNAGGGHSGDKVMAIMTNGGAQDSRLFSSGLNLTAGVEYSISCWAMVVGGGDRLKIYVTDGNTQMDLLKELNPESGWVDGSASYTPTTSGTYYLCFQACTVDESGYGIFIDDVSVTGPGDVPNPSAALLEEDFESAAEGDVASGWMALDQGGNNNPWGATNAGGAQGMVMYVATTGAVQNSWLISPVMALTGGVEYSISCQAYVIGGGDNLEIRLVDENLLHFDELLIQSSATSGTQELATSFTPTAGGSYRLLFVAKTTDSYGTGMLIDDVKVTETSVTPPTPPAALLEEDFENADTGDVPTGWTAEDLGGNDNKWGAGPMGGERGTVMYIETAGAEQNSWLVSPEMALTAGIEYNISCLAYIMSIYDELEVRMVKFPMADYGEVIKTQGGTISPFEEVAATFTPTTNGNYSLVFVARTSTVQGAGIAIDDVKVSEVTGGGGDDGGDTANETLDEGFEATAVMALPNDWTQDPAASGAAIWLCSNSTAIPDIDMVAHTGTNYAMYMKTTPGALNAWMFTKNFALQADSVYSISFWLNMPGGLSVDKLELGVGSAANAASMTVLATEERAIGTWTEVKVLYAPTANGTYYLGFHACSSSKTGAYIYIDDVQVKQTTDNDLEVLPVEFYSTYVQVPVSQNTLQARAINKGKSAQHNVVFSATVNGVSVGASTPIALLAPGDTSEIMTITGANLVVGENKIAYTVLADEIDGNLDNNSDTITVAGSNNVYAYDNMGTITNAAMIDFAVTLGNIFEISNTANLSQVAVAVGYNYDSAVNFNVVLYHVENDTTSGAQIFSQPASLYKAKLGFMYVNVPSTPLTPGRYYLAIEGDFSADSIFAIGCDMQENKVYYGLLEGKFVKQESSVGAFGIRMVFESSTCAAPTNLNVVAKPTRVMFSWDNTAPQYILSFGVKGAAQADVHVSAPNIVIDGFPSETEFTWSVKALCDATHQSESTAGPDFVTPSCDVTTLPWVESFEEGIPGCFTQEYVIGANGDMKWKIVDYQFFAPFVAEDGEYFVNLSYNNEGNMGITKLVTPKFTLNPSKQYLLGFFYALPQTIMNATNEVIQDSLTVYYKTSRNGAWRVLARYGQSVMDWKEEYLVLPNPSEEYFIAFEGYALGGLGVALDKITVAEAPLRAARVVSIDKPVTKGFMESETVSVTVQNLGSQKIGRAQAIYYLDGGNIPVQATATFTSDSIPLLGTFKLNFTTQANMSVHGLHSIEARIFTINGQTNSGTFYHSLTKSIINYGDTAVMGANTQVTAASGVFVDDGIDSDYDLEPATHVITFNPVTPGDRMRVSFTAFDLYPYNSLYPLFPGDKLYVYNGATPDPDSLVTVMTDYLTSYLLPTFTSEAADGKLTFKFVGGLKTAAFPGWAANFTSVTPPAVDVVLESVIAPDDYMLTVNETVRGVVRNMGSQTLSDIPVKCDVGCNIYSATIPGPLAPFERAEYSITGMNLSVPGSYTLKVYADMAGDGDRSSDTLTAKTSSMMANDLYWDFESGRMPANFTMYKLDSGVPSGTSATEAWIVNEFNKYNICATSVSAFTNPTIQANRWMVLPQLQVLDSAKLTWFAASAFGADINRRDGYKVMLSTTDSAPESFTTTLHSTSSVLDPINFTPFETPEVSLAAYHGQAVYVAFVQNSKDKEYIMIDNIRLTGAFTVKNDSAFAYTPTPPVGCTFSWTRAAVTGVSNAASSGSGSINENLHNTTKKPVTVTYECSFTQSGCETRSVQIKVTVLPTYTITAMAKVNGAISPAGVTVVPQGYSQEFKFIPSNGYELDSIWVDNALAVAQNDSSYTFTNVEKNYTITVSFKIKTYQVQATVNNTAYGTISPTGTIVVAYGHDTTFTITPKPDYRIAEVLVDSKDSTIAVQNGKYTFRNVLANHSIRVNFGPTKFVITASVNGGNGTITPAGATEVGYAASQSYTITPNAGYTLSKLLVDGKDSTAAVTDGTYTFNNVIATHTIVASFSKLTGVGSSNFDKLKMYPNPVENGIITITCEQYKQGDKVEVSTMGGDLVLVQPATEGTTTVDIAHLPSGIYIVKVGNAVAKMVKK